MDSVQIHDLRFELLFGSEEIHSAVENISEQLNTDLADKEVIFLVILNGSFLFAADIIRCIKMNCRITFMTLASYDGNKNSGKVKQLIGLHEELKDKTVVIIEDIVDSGNTLHFVVKQVEAMKPAEIKVATLLFKPDAYKYDYKIDYMGYKISNRFVVGYGLDYNGLGRNLNSIYTQTDI
jgi:hypoxanthine phosphoribosyltransferase